MWRRLIISVCFVLVVGLVNSASATDPNLIVAYGFDGSYLDYSGHSYDGLPSAEGLSFDPCVPPYGGGSLSLYLDGNGYVDAPINTVNPFDGSSDFTIVAWFNTTAPGGSYCMISSARDNSQTNHPMSVMVTGEGKLGYDNFYAGFLGGITEVNDGEWHHAAVTHVAVGHTPSDPNHEIKLYVDASSDGTGTVNPAIPNIEEDTVRIGASMAQESPGEHWPAYKWDGYLDSVAIYNRALSPEEMTDVMENFVPAAAATAGGPNPRNNAEHVCPDVVLSWLRGIYAVSHDVYLGTDFNDVNDATTTYDPNNVYMGRQPVEDTNYTPDELLDWGQSYYWRIDEVNDANIDSPWKGAVWAFTVDDGRAREPYPSDRKWAVPTDANLSWTPGCLAASHDVYFGTDFNDVNDATSTSHPNVDYQNVAVSSYDPGLGSYTRYYWRVDERSSTTMRGDIWTFKTIGGALVHFKFDGTLGEDLPDSITDSTGNVTFTKHVGSGDPGSLTYGSSNPLFNTSGTSVEFSPNAGLYRLDTGKNDVLDLAIPAYTIEMFVRPDRIDDMALVRKYRNSYILSIGDDGEVRFVQAGEWEFNPLISAEDLIAAGNWYHIAGVFDSTDPCEPQRIYINGEKVAAGPISNMNPDNDHPAAIGQLREPGGDAGGFFDGLIDEVRISDTALDPSKFILRGDPGMAWFPRPRDYGKDLPRDVVLSWRPGDFAVSHDVYLGTDWDDVNDADSSLPAGASVYKGRQSLDANTYSADLLELETTYYWRIDEVNEANGNSPWKGYIWRFTVGNYIIIDDMESYNQTDNRIYDTWNDGYANESGSELDLGIGTGTNPNPVHGGEQSMIYLYDNADPRGWDFDYYSEVSLAITDPCDWTDIGIKILTLFFDGNSTNDANEQMYVGLEDTGGNYAQVDYGHYADEDMNDIMEEEWQQWDIALADFNGVSLTDVRTLYIGFGIRGNLNPGGTPGGSGIAFFDDIRLYLPKCVPTRLKPFGDFTDDCKVDLADVGEMAEKWLRTDMAFDEYTDPGTTGLIGWWKLDEGDGNNVADSSIYGNNGTVEDDYEWVLGYDGTNWALEFDDDARVLVPDDGNTPELRPETAVSASAWIYYSDDQDNARAVVKGADNRETYLLQVDEENELGFLVREHDPCGSDDFNDFAVDSDRLGLEEWIHIAGTFDGYSNTLSCYMNGGLVDSNDNVNFVSAGGILSQDTSGFAIGNRSDDDNRVFEGTIDDVRVYERALSAAEVAWLASNGTGYVPLVLAVNIYDKEPAGSKAINFRDLAELMNHWREEELRWPE